MTRLLGVTGLALVAAVALAACGSSSGGSGATNSSSTSGMGSASTANNGNAYGGGGYGGGGSSSSSSTKPATSAMVIKVGKGSPGSFLVDGSGQTLYLFKADTGTKSMCNGACSQTWPALTTKGAPKAGSGIKASLLGTTKRSDGTTEVTYNGHPLYTYSGDSGAGQANGQGSTAFGAQWWVVSMNGTALTS